MTGYLITKTIVNEQGQPELWLHDGSRRLTAEEVEFLGKAVAQSQSVHGWKQRAAQADDLGPLLTFRWNPEAQDLEVWQDDGARKIPHEELLTLRDRILERRGEPKTSAFTVGGS